MRPWGEELAARGAVRLGGLIEAPDYDAMLKLFDALPADRPGACFKSIFPRNLCRAAWNG